MTDNAKPWVPDWALDMARVPFDPNAERAAANFSTGGPTGMIPRDTTAPASAPAPPSSGWQNERPLGTQPGIDPDFMESAMMVLQIQSQQIAALAALVMRNDNPKAKPKPKPRQR